MDFYNKTLECTSSKSKTFMHDSQIRQFLIDLTNKIKFKSFNENLSRCGARTGEQERVTVRDTWHPWHWQGRGGHQLLQSLLQCCSAVLQQHAAQPYLIIRIDLFRGKLIIIYYLLRDSQRPHEGLPFASLFSRFSGIQEINHKLAL